MLFLARKRTAPKGRRQLEDFIADLSEKNAASIRKLWDSYNTGGSRADHLRVTEAANAMSYLLAFHPNNLQRNFQILNRWDPNRKISEFLSTQSELHLLDLGCGAGAWSASVLEWLAKKPSSKARVSIDLIDRSKYFLEVTAHGVNSQFSFDSLKSLQADLRDDKAQYVIRKIASSCEKNNRFLILGLSYVWNEFSSPKAKARLLDVLKDTLHLSTPVLFFFSEPGREQEAREAQALREWQVDLGMRMLYPCPSSDSCPMLKTQKDWCYSEVPDPDLQEWSSVGRVLKLRRQKLSTAYYISANPKAYELMSEILRPSQPIVGFPEVGGKKQTLVCKGIGLSKVPTFSPSMLRGQRFSKQDRGDLQSPKPRKSR